MNEHFSRIEALLFSKTYDELSETEKQLVSQELDEMAYRSIQAEGREGAEAVAAPAFIEARLLQAYRRKYPHNSRSIKAGMAVAAALLLGLIIGLSATWHLSLSPTRYINVPEIIVLKDTVYLPARDVKKELPPAAKSPTERKEPTAANPVAEVSIPRRTTSVVQPVAAPPSELMPQVEPDADFGNGQPAKAEKALMDVFVPMARMQ